jgi:hypothetical protein
MTNICRCGSYRRIRAGIHQAAKTGLAIDSVIHMIPATAVLSQGLDGAQVAAHANACSGPCQHEHDLAAAEVSQSDGVSLPTQQRGFSSNCA